MHEVPRSFFGVVGILEFCSMFGTWQWMNGIPVVVADWVERVLCELVECWRQE